MKKKNILFIVIGVVVVIAIAIGIYFIARNKKPVTPTESTALSTDNFSLTLPAGWNETEPSVGISAMAVNANEVSNDEAIQKINFKSYVAVTYDTFDGKSMADYVQSVKDELKNYITDITFTKDEDLTINGAAAHTIEAELTQQDINFKALVVIVTGKDQDVWVISFNTAKAMWDSYKETFYNVAKSFALKQ